MLRPIALATLLAMALLSGCTEPEAEPVVAAPPPAPVPEEEPVDWTAVLGTGVCVQMTVVVTASACGLSGPALTSPTASDGFEATYVYEADGRDLAGGLLSLEWDATSIATQGLRATVVLLEDCPDECSVNRTILSTAGVSPLELPISAHDLRKDMALSVSIMPADLTKGAATSIGQEIHLTGTLSFVEDPDGDPREDDEEDEDEDS